ncbi:MAG: plasmid pRiA4b ORF-3 family protein, partial [Acidimicrobiales bacterium]
MAASGSSTTKVHQLKVVLRGAEPPIWRRLQVPAAMTLADLHRVVQVAMGWEDYHLHQFEIAGVTYGIDDRQGWGPAPKDERRATLDRVARKGTTLTYEYDFGDSWDHDIKVEKVLDAEDGKSYPVCVAGERACPPEDSGGVWGYEVFLAALADPDHDEHDQFLEWVGGEFDPEHLD